MNIPYGRLNIYTFISDDIKLKMALRVSVFVFKSGQIYKKYPNFRTMQKGGKYIW